MYSLILLNGGIGKRFGASEPKQLKRLHQIPIFIHTLREVLEIPRITKILMNYPNGWKQMFIELLDDYGISDRIQLVSCGSTRQQSVKKMLEVSLNDENKYVIIHEAVRPLVSSKEFEKLINSSSENISFGLEIPFTVLKLDKQREFVAQALPRDLLVNVQLPQKFLKTSLLEAHKKAEEQGTSFTEDASLLHHYGTNVKFVEGNENNIKITSPNDLEVIEALLNDKNRIN